MIEKVNQRKILKPQKMRVFFTLKFLKVLFSCFAVLISFFIIYAFIRDICEHIKIVNYSVNEWKYTKINTEGFFSISAVSLTVSAVTLCNTIMGWLNSDKKQLGYCPFDLMAIDMGKDFLRFLQMASVFFAVNTLIACFFSYKRVMAMCVVACVMFVFMLLFIWLRITTGDHRVHFVYNLLKDNLEDSNEKINKYSYKNEYGDSVINHIKGKYLNQLVLSIDICSEKGIKLLLDSGYKVFYDWNITDDNRIQALFTNTYILLYEITEEACSVNTYKEIILNVLKRNDGSDQHKIVHFATICAILNLFLDVDKYNNELDHFFEVLYKEIVIKKYNEIIADIFVFCEMKSIILPIDKHIGVFTKYIYSFEGIYDNIVKNKNLYMTCAKSLRKLGIIKNINLQELIESLCVDLDKTTTSSSYMPVSKLVRGLKGFKGVVI